MHHQHQHFLTLVITSIYSVKEIDCTSPHTTTLQYFTTFHRQSIIAAANNLASSGSDEEELIPEYFEACNLLFEQKMLSHCESTTVIALS